MRKLKSQMSFKTNARRCANEIGVLKTLKGHNMGTAVEGALNFTDKYERRYALYSG